MFVYFLCVEYDDMDDALEFIKRECKRDFTIDYSVCQIKEKCEDEYIICHLATSKLLAYVGGFEGFDWGKMSTVYQ